MNRMQAPRPAIERIVLASSSPRRRELIQLLGLRQPIELLSSDVDESTPSDWPPPTVVEQLALRKARAVRARMQGAPASGAPSLIVGADTIVVLDGRVMGKPADTREAEAMLRSLQGRTHEVYTGVALVETAGGAERAAHRMTRVAIKPLDAHIIARYVATGEPRDKAGGYGIQGYGAALVDAIEGCYFNVVGLPLSLLADMLGEFGIDYMRHHAR